MSHRLDLLVRGGRVVTPEGLRRADLGVAEGTIVALGPEIDEPATHTLDASGQVVFHGILDAHVHFNAPGRSDWEGLTSGPKALAAGGGTAFFDMPLNSLPPVLDRASFDAKRTFAEHQSCLDFGLWGGLVPGNLDRLEELANAGVVGFKAFLCASGVPEFEAVADAATLRAGMKRAAALRRIVAVHAEDEALTTALTGEARARGEKSARAWLATRPVEAEVRAIHLALELAGETGCALHVVHVSSPEGVEAISEARRRGVDVTAETCPHYLLLTEEDTVQVGAAAKCAPPLRDEARRQRMWDRLEDGSIDTVGSDHSPAPPSMKTAADFFEIWGGISGCQHGFALLLSAALERAPADRVLPRLAQLLATNVADRFGLAHQKGRLAVGMDADFTLLDLDAPHALDNSRLFYRHVQGPYHGRTCRVRVVHTLARGAIVYTTDTSTLSVHHGRLLRPSP